MYVPKYLANLEGVDKLSQKDIDLMMRKREEEFRCAVAPLWRFLKENYHPHTSVIVTPCSAEIVEGSEYVYNKTEACGHFETEEAR